MSNFFREPGSYRDPSSFVFFYHDQVYRVIDDKTRECIDVLKKRGAWDRLFERGLMVETKELDSGDALYRELAPHVPGVKHLLQHRRIETISYPYEWSFSMLADAALLHLDLQSELLKSGLSLKDASAFNVQFESARPVFIDIGSIERPRRLNIWYAYGQFCRMFLYPLMLMNERQLNFRQVFITELDGVQVSSAYRMMGFWKSMAPQAFFDVYLQHLLMRKSVEQTSSTRWNHASENLGDPEVQLVNLRRLERKIKRLVKKHDASSLWSEYAAIRNYTAPAIEEKRRVISRYLETCKPKQVVDLGCNTGEFSLLAARAGAKVIALDSDPNAVEGLYREATKEKLNILPLVADLSNPSPGVGLMNRERSPLVQRVKGDMVFALALIHHLMVSARMSLPQIVELLAGFTTDYLVLEHIETDDSMFQNLLKFREDYYQGYCLAELERHLGARFEILDRVALPESKRTLLLCRLSGQ